MSRPLVGFDGGGGLVSSSHLGRSTLIMEVIEKKRSVIPRSRCVLRNLRFRDNKNKVIFSETQRHSGK